MLRKFQTNKYYLGRTGSGIIDWERAMRQNKQTPRNPSILVQTQHLFGLAERFPSGD
jgi:hypothetical protein